jgi:D-threo-aldose 1-dehydrogenase
LFDYSYDGVIQSVTESLERLRVDAIDVALLHDPENNLDLALTEGHAALEQLKQGGVVRAIGVGANESRVLSECAGRAAFDVFLLAGRYTLLDQTAAEDGLLSLCFEKGIRLIVGGVFNSGVLASAGAGARFNYQRADELILERVRRLAELCSEFGVPLAAAALQFPFTHPAVASVLIGCRSALEVESNAMLSQIDISPELWSELARRNFIDSAVDGHAVVN